MYTAQSLLIAIIDDGNWDMDWAAEYAEPGYTAGKKGILFANWNNETRKGTEEERKAGEYWPVVDSFRSRAGDMFEKAGFECEWSDEWSTCECGKAFRYEGDHMGWRPSYIIHESGYTCRECWADCLSVGDRMQACVDAGFSVFAARRDTLPTDDMSNS